MSCHVMSCHVMSCHVMSCVVQLTPHWGFSVADYIRYHAYFKPKLAIFATIEILPVNFPVGGNWGARKKSTTFGRVLTNFFHMSGALGSSNNENLR